MNAEINKVLKAINEMEVSLMTEVTCEQSGGEVMMESAEETRAMVSEHLDMLTKMKRTLMSIGAEFAMQMDSLKRTGV